LTAASPPLAPTPGFDLAPYFSERPFPDLIRAEIQHQNPEAQARDAVKPFPAMENAQEREPRTPPAWENFSFPPSAGPALPAGRFLFRRLGDEVKKQSAGVLENKRSVF